VEAKAILIYYDRIDELQPYVVNDWLCSGRAKRGKRGLDTETPARPLLSDQVLVYISSK
jgi:hypothetical protein